MRSDPPRSPANAPSNPKCPAKRRRISFHSIFHGKSKGKQKQEVSVSSIESIPVEVAETDKKPQVSDSRTTLTSSDSPKKASPGLLECPLCLLRHPFENVPKIMTCHHRSCLDCLRQYLRIEITESRVNISCPECSERLNPHDIRMILNDQALMEKYEEFMLRRYLASDPDCRWCPAPDCGYAVIAYGCACCPKISCGRDGCGTEFCYHCKQLWHPNQTCDNARQQRAQSLQIHTKQTTVLNYGQESGNGDEIKPCPRCGAYIIKMNDGSCNHMTCAVCGCEFCWLCMKEISDLHYLSPSGCTFWGKKPWSKKKKILWQLGTLIGAPVGISLIAGIAIPAMIIGIPVYIGRKVHSRYDGKKTSKHKRNLAITGAVTLSVIASPVIAAVSVGIGVPIMLAYVYGVVPVSLCRGGGCGVSAASGKGVKIEFDEGDGPITVADAWRALKNPSIGDSSVEGLTSVLSASGSPIDGVSVMQSNCSDTASFAALSGSTLAGGVLMGSSGQHDRLDIQADIQKGNKLHKDSISLGATSDNASTRAMAGSIISSYNPLDRECNNLEVQVDIESKPSHLCFTSDSSINELLHIHSQSVEGLCHEEKDCLFMSDHSDCLISNTCDVTLAQPESIRSDGNSTDTQSDDVPDISSDECDSPSPIHDRHLEITASDNKLLNTESFECEDYEQTECVLEQGGPQTETVVHYV
ncbi:E3 ubiquitin-protein ligase RNF19B isoform X1 [Leucoraja erinacea]|uniref:E3 ubiquitin-protein ligase RNF19B isoform X1 n=3 Tax=Leucoraja erinaceus TaxID=7782 RepID=UPI002454F425|nr:E3 ubiquitin-protein ligase RNF19B isoform X1 [Leucoraja erinacea]XP_055512352.1 E3 ubiquitin-protein ligase RNF19B isoform X1 [Leucoraja erinacea]